MEMIPGCVKRLAIVINTYFASKLVFFNSALNFEQNYVTYIENNVTKSLKCNICLGLLFF